MTDPEGVIDDLADVLVPVILERMRILDDQGHGEKPMSLDQMAEFLGTSKSLLSEQAQIGTIPHFRIGRRLLFRPSEVLEALRAPMGTKGGEASNRPNQP